MTLELTLAAGRYAITEPLLDGAVVPQGASLRTFTMPSPERHWRMLRHQEFDVCELSLAGYVQAFSRRPSEWAALPVFPHRRYRHGYIFVPAHSTTRDPIELNGATVGLRTWATTAGVWMRGILQDEYGVDLRSIKWVTEHAEHVGGTEGAGFSVGQLPGESTLREGLRGGSLDAVIYPERLTGADVRPLFSDPAAAERDYATKTGLFPIMHLVAVRRALLEEHPWLANELVKAFEEAKRRAYQRVSNPRWLPLAWGEYTLTEQENILGRDPWRYGVEQNSLELETVLRYCSEQRLSASPLSPQDLFWPSTLQALPGYTAVR